MTEQESGGVKDGQHAQSIIRAFPQWELRLWIFCAAGLFAWVGVGRWLSFETMSLAHAGCLITIATAVCEWRVIDWRLRVDELSERMSIDAERRRIALSIHRLQVANTLPWVHGLFGLGTLAWGFG